MEDVLEANDGIANAMKSKEVNGTKGEDFDSTFVQILPQTSQSIFCVISAKSYNFKCFYTFVYAANDGLERRDLWEELIRDFRYLNGKPWCIAGDINVTLYPNEHSSGSFVMTPNMMEFQDCLNKIKVEEICKSGLHFTWTNNLQRTKAGNMTGILKKLDRVMSNEEFINQYPKAHAKFLPYIISDHTPSILCITTAFKKKIKAFSLFKRVVSLRDELKRVQIDIDKDPHNTILKNLEAKLVKEFYVAEADEENFLSQAKIKWLSEGDKNNNYFHKEVENYENLFQRKISNEFALNMIANVLDSEIKRAMFDIEDSKAPGPDGFTAAFFKKAWRVIGNDVCKVVKEFFSSRRMLGEINATLIFLIPNVENPNKVTDFRPIACCNVPYKCISKVITNSIKPILGILVSNNQCAFIPGRRFTINVNGDRIGYFKGGRGLRQDDPISPYLFTLIIEVFSLMLKRQINSHPRFQYHFRCKPLKLVHVCFADDLLVMCHGDSYSVRVIKSALDEFSACSGLFPNNSKSTVFFGSLNEEEKSEILNVIPFTTGKLPVRYLGVLLIAKRLSVKDCGCLLSPLSQIVTYRDLYDARLSSDLKVSDMVCNGQWRWPTEWQESFPMITSLDVPAINNDNDDKIVWRTREGRDLDFSVSMVNTDLNYHAPVIVTSGVLKTNSKSECPFAKELWNKLTVIADIHTNSLDLNEIVHTLISNGNGSNIRSIIRRLAFAASVYSIWQERNGRIFKESKRSCDEVFKNLVEMIKNKLIGITVKDSLAGCLDLGDLSFLSISETKKAFMQAINGLSSLYLGVLLE
ncbi:RNA-directed DNA polymerase, eukaryota, reverse transcriptase zinc-binding domain protein [Tanacetum coccineum]